MKILLLLPTLFKGFRQSPFFIAIKILSDGNFRFMVCFVFFEP